MFKIVLVAIILIVDSYAGKTSECYSRGLLPSAWDTVGKSGKGYYINTFFTADWNQAHRYCKLHGMQLFSPVNDEEFFHVHSYLKNNGYSKFNFWIGGTDLESEGNFYWIMTRTPMTLSRAAWIVRQPDNAGRKEHCVHMWKAFNLLLNDHQCRLKFNFICESETLDEAEEDM